MICYSPPFHKSCIALCFFYELFYYRNLYFFACGLQNINHCERYIPLPHCSTMLCSNIDLCTFVSHIEILSLLTFFSQCFCVFIFVGCNLYLILRYICRIVLYHNALWKSMYLYFYLSLLERYAMNFFSQENLCFLG